MAGVDAATAYTGNAMIRSESSIGVGARGVARNLIYRLLPKPMEVRNITNTGIITTVQFLIQPRAPHFPFGLPPSNRIETDLYFLF
jgi:hypothetical protein